MIIEFNGLPGTGKTTVAKNLILFLEEKGIPCYYNKFFKEIKIKRYLSYLFDGTIELYFLGRKFADKSSNNISGEKREIVKVFIGYYRLYRFFLKNKKNHVLIIDQGIIQALISILHIDLMVSTKELEKIFAFLKRKGVTFLNVSCNTNVKLSVERIKNRNTFGGRLDRLDLVDLQHALENQAQNFESIRNCCKNVLGLQEILIDTSESLEKNVNNVYDAAFRGLYDEKGL